MAPLRNNRDRHRPNRGQIDHDIMEGLPVRQWRKQTATVNKPQAKEQLAVENNPNDRWREYPMPKGSELYPPHSQALLRAARLGQFNQKKPNEDDKENEGDEDVEVEADSGYVATRWAPVPKDQEKAEPEFLAKRRKGLASRRDPIVTIEAKPPMRKVKVRKVDAEGNASVYEVLAPEGVAVDGEIVEDDTIMVEAPAPGTVVEGVGIANAEGIVVAIEPAAPTPQRRRPPPPKRKNKGPGRGRKKKQMVAPVEGAPAGENVVKAADGSDLLQVPAPSGTPGAADSPMQDGEDGSDDGSDDGEDGEDGEGSGNEAATPTPSRSPSKSHPPPTEQEGTEPLPTQALTEPSSTATDVPAGAGVIEDPKEPVTETALRPESQDQEMTDAPSSVPPTEMPPTATEPAQVPVSAPESVLPPIESLPIPQPVPLEAPLPETSTLPISIQEATATLSPQPLEPVVDAPQAPPAPTDVSAIISAPEEASTLPAINAQAPIPADTTVVEDPTAQKIQDAVVPADIPEGHNALDGLAEPKPAASQEEQTTDYNPLPPVTPPREPIPPPPSALPGIASVVPEAPVDIPPPAPIETDAEIQPAPVDTAPPADGPPALEAPPPPATLSAPTSLIGPPPTLAAPPTSSPPPPPEPAPATLPSALPVAQELRSLPHTETTVGEPQLPPIPQLVSKDEPSSSEEKPQVGEIAKGVEDTKQEVKEEHSGENAGEKAETKPEAEPEKEKISEGEDNLLGTLEAHLEKST